MYIHHTVVGLVLKHKRKRGTELEAGKVVLCLHWGMRLVSADPLSGSSSKT